MRFGFFVFIVAIAVFASIVGSGLSRVPKSEGEVLRLQNANGHDLTEAGAEESNSSRLDGAVELNREPDGHFYADVQVNGATLHMMVDTGATQIALSREDARSAGIATSIGMPEVVGRGETKTVTFKADKPGVFPMVCQLHPAHVGGQLVVLPCPVVSASPASSAGTAG